MKPIWQGELVNRTTVEQDLMLDPERLLTYVTVRSLTVMIEARQRHYEGYGVSAVAPVYDNDGHSKILAASNYRPNPDEAPNDTRVCAEQALIDNSIHEGDLSLGVLFVRGPKPDPDKPIVGCREGVRSLHLCRPCRARVLDVVGPQLLIVTFNDEDPEPTEAITLSQMLGYHDVGNVYPELPDNKTARDVAIEALTNLSDLTMLKKPAQSHRVIKAGDRNC